MRAIAVLSLLLVACSDRSLPVGNRAEGFSLASQEHQSEVLRRLGERGIPYEVEDDGTIRYMLDNQAEVLGVVRHVTKGERYNSLDLEALPVTSKKQKELYMEELSAAGIPYEIVKVGAIENIKWRAEYGPEVDSIRQRVNTTLANSWERNN